MNHDEDLPRGGWSTIGEATTDERTIADVAAVGEAAGSDRYRLGGVLGRGGMGEVLEAHDDQIGRDVAVKRLRTEQPNLKQVQRFMREARIQGRLEHPAIVPVHELGFDGDGRPYFAMKKLAGTTLAQILARDIPARESKNAIGTYSLQRLLRALADVCLAVELAHTKGFVHRDLKPENIMLGGFGETYVLDWGVAKVKGEDDSALLEGLDTDDLVTAAGAAVGTPGYMSPEQARALSDVDPRADVYSLGCVLFEILTGERLHPKGQAGMTSAVRGIDSRPSARTPDRDIPPELDELTVHATATDRDQRIQTARALGERIQQYLDGDRDLALRKKLARSHLEAATVAFAAEDRARAMREAGRALALDPTLHTAGGLITRMMVEPPKTLPPEVAEDFDADSRRVARRTMGVGAVASAAYLLFLPVLMLAGSPEPVYLVTMAAASIASILLLRWAQRPGRAYVMPIVIALHVLLLAVCARMYSPFLLGPGVAVVTAIGFMTGPQYAKRQATWVAMLTSAAVIGPWALEQAGILSKTMTVSGGTAVIHAAAIQGPTSTFTLLVLFTIAIVTTAVVLSRGLRQAERSARRHMHLQAWQLRQLVVGD